MAIYSQLTASANTTQLCTQCCSLQDSWLSSLPPLSPVATNDLLLEIWYEWLMLAAAALHCNTGHSYNGQCTAECRVIGGNGRLHQRWTSILVGLSVVDTTDVPGGRTSIFRGGAPQPKSNLVHCRFKIFCLVAAVSMICIRIKSINWPKFNFLKLILMKIISSCSLSSIKASATSCSFVLTSRLDHRSLDTHYWLLTLQLKHYVLWCELATVNNLQQLYLRSFIVFHLLYSW